MGPHAEAFTFFDFDSSDLSHGKRLLRFEVAFIDCYLPGQSTASSADREPRASASGIELSRRVNRTRKTLNRLNSRRPTAAGVCTSLFTRGNRTSRAIPGQSMARCNRKHTVPGCQCSRQLFGYDPHLKWCHG